MIHLDTSALVAALSGPGAAAERLRGLIDRRERLALSTIVLYEWWRGPRLPRQLEMQEALFPASQAVAFGSREATLAAAISRKLKHPRGRSIDVAIAACAIAQDAALWTLNRADFTDIPGLELV